MCTISSTLQLCTCSEKEFNELKDYWILNRFEKGKNIQVLGEPVMPYLVDKDRDIHNKELLLRLLNEGKFDDEIQPQENDILELSFTETKHDQRIVYAYKFEKGSWQYEAYDTFSIMSHYEEAKSGKIVDAIE